MKVFNNIKSILRNEYLTYFIGFFTILFVMETLNNPSNNLLVILRFTFSNRLIMILCVLIIVLIGYINIPLSLLLLTNYIFLLNINKKVETFNNRIPDLVDKNTQISYQKNFGKLNKKNIETKKKEKEDIQQNKKEIPEEKTYEKPKEERKMVLSYKNNSDNKISNERLDLEEKEYNIERELQKIKREPNENTEKTLETDLEEKNYEIKKDYEVLEDESTGSSGSSDTSDSSESSESSDSDGVNSVSMDEAREQVMKKIRNKIKKNYVKKK
jgi:hypothetical protein